MEATVAREDKKPGGMGGKRTGATKTTKTTKKR
jgi:hypothetical protein